jgi:hypothetical protein
MGAAIPPPPPQPRQGRRGQRSIRTINQDIAPPERLLPPLRGWGRGLPETRGSRPGLHSVAPFGGLRMGRFDRSMPPATQIPESVNRTGGGL